MSQSEEEPGPDEEEESFTVDDRRWWSRGKQAEGQGAAEEPQDQPGQDPRTLEYLREQLDERDRKLEAVLQRQRRALAELERAKDRIERDAERQLQLSRHELIVQQLDLLDDLERAIDGAVESSDRNLLEGVSLVARKFVSKLGELGVTHEDPMGKRFDPARHDAVSVVPVADRILDGTVVGVVKKGYLIGDQVLRPAVVAVGRYSA